MVLECGIRWAVEKRRREKVLERQQIAEQELQRRKTASRNSIENRKRKCRPRPKRR